MKRGAPVERPEAIRLQIVICRKFPFWTPHAAAIRCCTVLSSEPKFSRLHIHRFWSSSLLPFAPRDHAASPRESQPRSTRSAGITGRSEELVLALRNTFHPSFIMQIPLLFLDLSSPRTGSAQLQVVGSMLLAHQKVDGSLAACCGVVDGQRSSVQACLEMVTGEGIGGDRAGRRAHRSSWLDFIGELRIAGGGTSLWDRRGDGMEKWLAIRSETGKLATDLCRWCP